MTPPAQASGSCVSQRSEPLAIRLAVCARPAGCASRSARLTRGLKVVHRWAARSPFTLMHCRLRYVKMCRRRTPWLYLWLYAAVHG